MSTTVFAAILWLVLAAIFATYLALVRLIDRHVAIRESSERGGIGKGLAVFVVAVVLAFAACLAIADDNNETDSFRPIQLVSHDYDCDPEWDDCGGYDDGPEGGQEYDGNRAGISPGPFDRSPVDFSNSCISLDCSGRDEGRSGEPGPDEPQATRSLFPPTFDGIRQFVLQTIQAGIEMGRLFADTVITFVSNLLVGIA